MEKPEFIGLLDTWLSGGASVEQEQMIGNYYNSFDQIGWNAQLMGDLDQREKAVYMKVKEAIHHLNNPKTRIQFQAEDFVADKEFIRWVFENNAADNSFWQQWLQQHPHKQQVAEEARILLRSLKIKEEISQTKLEQGVQEIMSEPQKRSSKGVLTFLSRWKYAAILAGIITAGAVLYFNRMSSSEKNNGNFGLLK